jgi:hypothetical protein
VTVRVLFAFQKALLRLAFAFFSVVRGRRAKAVSWVVGVDEIASMVYRIAALIPHSHSVALSTNGFYDFGYDTSLRPSRSALVSLLRRVVIGPVVLARLLTRAEGVLYLGASGFLLADVDQREYELRFVRRRGVRVACYFVGSDIRSPMLMHELERSTGLANLSTHIGEVDPVLDSQGYDDVKRAIAGVAERCADIIFNSPTDQLSYLTGRTEPVTYFYPDDAFAADFSKFRDLSRVVMVHAPSSPLIKGTPLVRAAVARLRAEGYDFEYVELTSATNQEVRRQLGRAHVALNQFYAFHTGVFGVEAMAMGCAVLMSADENIEHDLPAGSNDAWIVTKNFEVYEKMKWTLDNPGRLEAIAARGEAWARENVAFSSAGPRLRALLGSVVDGTYTRERDPGA